MRKGEVKVLVIVVAVAAVLLLAYVGYKLFYAPWQAYHKEFVELSTKTNTKRSQVAAVKKQEQQLKHYQHLSLPPDIHEAELAYNNFLLELVERHNFRLTGPGLRHTGKSAAKAAAARSKSLTKGKNNEPVYTALQFKLNAIASLVDLTRMLKEFDEAPIKHRIRNMTVKPLDPDYEKKTNFLVSISMDIEALKVEGAVIRSESLTGIDEGLAMIDVVTTLGGGPAGIAEVPWVVGPTGPLARELRRSESAIPDPMQIASANIFVPYRKPEPKIIPQPPVIDPEPVYEGPDTRPFYKLSSIIKSDTEAEAWLYSAYHNTWNRLRPDPADSRNQRDSNGLPRLETDDTFKPSNLFAVYRHLDRTFDGLVFDDDRIMFIGKVLYIDHGKVYFEAEETIWSISVGQSMMDASEATDDDLARVGLLKEVNKAASASK